MDILVVKVQKHYPIEWLRDLREDILRQKEGGVVILPAYCETLVISDDSVVKVAEVAEVEKGDKYDE